MSNAEKTGLLRFGIVVLFVLALLLSSAGALGVVYLKQQISRSASDRKHLEQDLRELERKDTFLVSKIAQAHSPEFLKKHAKLALGPPQEQQVVWGTLESTRSGRDDVLPQPFVVTFDLALLDNQPAAHDVQ